MKYKYKVEEMAPTRTRYTFTDRTPRGELLQMDIMKCTPDNTNPRALPRLWLASKYINVLLNSYYSIETYVTDANGVCRGLYNPQIIPGTSSLNFKWVMEATPENLEKIINEVCRLAYQEPETMPDK